MPQLAPMNWLVLFLYFSGLLYLTAVKLFFMLKLSPAHLSEVKNVVKKEPLLEI